jgi:photosystem II stability/assembly factor-like uncharacterized protein
MKRWLPEALAVIAILAVVSYGFAQTWTQTSGSFGVDNQTIALSADGNIIMTVGSTHPSISTNRGVTWSPFPTNSLPASTNLFRQITMSADGSKVIGNSYYYNNLSGGTIYVSKDSANSWYRTSMQNCGAIAISKDGNKLFAGINGGSIYESTDFGTNWFSTGAPSKSWFCLSISADGTKLIADASNDYIYTNSGFEWAASSLPSNYLYSITASTDGNCLVATGIGGTYVSTNFGSSWTLYSRGGTLAAASADGNLLIFRSNGSIYTSTNFGINWTLSSGLPYAYGIAVSADGSEMLAGAGGGIWIYQTTPAPQLSLNTSTDNFLLSWLVPSTNFVVQQSPDLVSWSSITDAPSLNLTNLNNELTLSPSNSSGFFRLISQ